jgi:hypothetical protein
MTVNFITTDTNHAVANWRKTRPGPRLRRLRCDTGAEERLVPFSCKGRGFCPRRGGRPMTERAARLVDGVLPRVPVRQWVLSLPYRLRCLLAWDHRLCRAVLGVYVRALLDFYRRQARQRSATRPPAAPTSIRPRRPLTRRSSGSSPPSASVYGGCSSVGGWRATMI